MVLCHFLRSYNFWLTGVTLIVIQQGDKGCKDQQRHISVAHYVIKQCLGLLSPINMDDNNTVPSALT